MIKVYIEIDFYIFMIRAGLNCTYYLIKYEGHRHVLIFVQVFKYSSIYSILDGSFLVNIMN